MRSQGVRGILIYCADYHLLAFDRDQRRRMTDDAGSWSAHCFTPSRAKRYRPLSRASAATWSLTFS